MKWCERGNIRVKKNIFNNPRGIQENFSQKHLIKLIEWFEVKTEPVEVNKKYLWNQHF